MSEMNNCRILMIDDSVTQRKINMKELSKGEFDVVECSSADEAMSKLNEGQYDLILTDLIMPEKSGWDLISMIRSEKRFDAVPIVTLSDCTNAFDEEKAIRKGAAHNLRKPLKIEELLNWLASQ